MLRRFAPALLLLTALAVADKPPVPVKIPALLKGKIDRNHVMVTGRVADFQARTSRAGNAYFTFDLVEGTQSIAVYGRGKLAAVPANGKRVMVVGDFRKTKKVGDRTFTNELDITPKKKGAAPRVAVLPK